MSKFGSQPSRNRAEVLKGEMAVRRGLEKRFVERAAAAAAEGDMDASRWAMDVSRKSGADAEALSGIVRTEHNERLAGIMAMRMMSGHTFPSFSPTPLTRYREGAERVDASQQLGRTLDAPGDMQMRIPLVDMLGGPAVAAIIDEAGLERFRQRMEEAGPIIALAHNYPVPPFRAPSEIVMDLPQTRPEAGTGPDAPGA
jgi:hypothetical protein